MEHIYFIDFPKFMFANWIIQYFEYMAFRIIAFLTNARYGQNVSAKIGLVQHLVIPNLYLQA